jgi:hypothetical protein
MKNVIGRRITAALMILLVTSIFVLPLSCSQPVAISSTKTTLVSQTNRWLEMLQVLPVNEPGGRENTFTAAFLQDHAYMAEKKELYPQISTDYEDYMFHNMPTLFSIGLRDYSDEEWKQTLGFIQNDVEQSVSAYRSMPVDYYEAVRGNLSPEKIDNAVKSGPMNEILEVVPYAGHEFYSWGTDRDMNLSKKSGVRPLGRGMRLGVIDDFIFWTSITDSMKEMIDSYEDNIQSLADLETYRLLAGGLTEFDTFTAFFCSESQSQSRFRDIYKDIIEKPGEGEGMRIRQMYAEQLQREVYLKPYQAFATGAGLDEKGYYLAIVLLNTDKQTARDNVAALEKQIGSSKTTGGKAWLEMIDSMEIQSEGKLTLAKLYGQASVWWDSFDMPLGIYEPLLMYKE